ncbi:MAG: hypothetical protein WCT37_05070 [Patescibacteria group bacterium]
MFAIKIPTNASTYSADGRWPIARLYRAFLSLTKSGFSAEALYYQKITNNGRKLALPILGLKTKLTGPAVWLLGSIHGEEPAGTIALAQNLPLIKSLVKKGIPVVMMPLCNPSGYLRNWRYPYHPYNGLLDKSVGNSDHVLLDLKGKNQPRRAKAACPDCRALANFVMETFQAYPPRIVLDLHEDEIATTTIDQLYGNKDQQFLRSTYIYSHGPLGTRDPIARGIVKLLKKHGQPVHRSGVGRTRFNEKVENGVVTGGRDGSIDELLTSKKIWLKGKVVPGPASPTGIVVETLTASVGFSLTKRLRLHGEILRSLPKFWKMVK